MSAKHNAVMASAKASLLVALETQKGSSKLFEGTIFMPCSLFISSTFNRVNQSQQIVLSESSGQSFDAQSGFVKEVPWGLNLRFLNRIRTEKAAVRKGLATMLMEKLCSKP